ncbi:hypothetical protein HG530_014415 [Fusarium avenaceum]|nr:hypothetical protein HG530_014415 [Fusarium avenaceum]
MLMATATKSLRMYPSLERHPRSAREWKNSQGKHVIKVGHLEAMAKHVAETNVFEVRRESFWYTGHSHRSSNTIVRRDRRSDASYSYFVEVLNRIRRREGKFQTSSDIPPLRLSWVAQIYLGILQAAGERCSSAYDQMKQESLKF